MPQMKFVIQEMSLRRRYLGAREVGVDLDQVHVADDERGRVLEVLAVVEQLAIGGGEVGVRCPCTPQPKQPRFQTSGPALAAGAGALRASLEGVGLARRGRPRCGVGTPSRRQRSMKCSCDDARSRRALLRHFASRSAAAEMIESAVMTIPADARRSRHGTGRSSSRVRRRVTRRLALFDVALDVRPARAGRDVPVDGAYVVAVLVLANLVELHASTLEDRVVFVGETVVDDLARRDLDAS